MFDLTSETIERPFRDKRTVPTILSIVAHVVVVGAVIGTTLFVITDGLPEVPTIMSFAAKMPAPQSPPPPPPAPGGAKSAAAKPVPTSGRDAAPVEAPTDIRPDTGIDVGIGVGVPGGVEGGVPGGVVGGIVGGLPSGIPPPAPPPPVERGPIRTGGALQAPALVRHVAPVYPDIAARAQVKGVVILEAVVGRDGHIEDVKVLRSIPLLDPAAVDAVRQWQYAPLLLNGKPERFVVTVTVSFNVNTTESAGW